MERVDTVAAGVAGDDGVQRAHVELVLALAGLEGVDEPRVIEDLREVEVGARKRRGWDGVDDGAVLGVQHAHEVAADPGKVVAGRRRDVDPAAGDLAQIVQGGRLSVAEDRAVAAGQDRRHPAALGGEALVTDGVDTAVDAMQSPLVEAPLDPGPRMP